MNFKTIATASHKKVQSPKALHTTLSTGIKIEGPQHLSLNNLGYEGTWIEISTPEPLKGATLNYSTSSQTLGEKMSWNATHIHTFKNKLVIASQAPYGEYFVSAFLTLLIELKIQHIIALATPEEENGYTPYIPKKIGPDLSLKFPGDFSVTLQSQKETQGSIVNTIQITSLLGTHTLTQHLYPHWPNQGFPDQVNILPFVRYVHENAFGDSLKGPTLVHCNAGIGRTGSLLALAWIVASGQKMQPSAVDTLLETLNNERPGPKKDEQKKAIKVFASTWRN
jgi:protein tyrosine phosphatase